MVKTNEEIKQFYIKLSSDGEQTVRRKLSQRVYQREKADLVENWLREQEQEMASRRHNETICLLRNAKISGSVTAIAVVIGAVIAFFALISGD